MVDSRDKMNKFVMVISDFVVNEYRSALWILRMDMSRLMVHAKNIGEKNVKKIGR